MNRLFSLFFFLFLSTIAGSLHAQNLTFRVEEFALDQFDMTPQEEERYDPDGHLYAVVKVTSDMDNDDLSAFKFDFGYLECIKDQRSHDGELWLFVQRNAKRMTIWREGYKKVEHTFLAIQAGRTYRLRLSVQPPKVVQRVLQFKVDPPNEKALVKVKREDSGEDYQLWGKVDENGSIDRLMETGIYLYTVAAPQFSTATGIVRLDGSEETFVERVKLLPNFGFLKIEGDDSSRGATVYVDDQEVGTVPYLSGRMECRDGYQLMIGRGDLFKTFTATFSIRQGETTTVSPRLESNSAEVTLQTAADAEIFVDGARRGVGKWTGRLSVGIHSVECRKADHVATEKQITVEKNVAASFNLDAPLPIVGALYVSSNPSGAKIYVDGNETGWVTPQKINNLLIGNHKVSLRRDRYQTADYNIEIRRDETANLRATLEEQSSAPAAQSAGSKEDKVFTVNGVSFTMKYVAPGTFKMGSRRGDPDEKPVHSVTISKGYYIGETEVTQALWKAVTGYSPTISGDSWSSTYGLGDNFPAYYINYEDVENFITKLNSLTGAEFRMPTEAEWEFAARGGNKSKGYEYCGSNTAGDVAWFRDNSGSEAHPVKTKASNELGLYDMSGNVREWCSDWYRSYSSSAVTDPTGPSTGLVRVLRGGSWGSNTAYCRSANRSCDTPAIRNYNLGVRLACSAVLP